MEIKIKYEIGQHIWVVYEDRGEAHIYDTVISEISYNEEGIYYITKEVVDFKEEQILLYEETNKLVDKIKELMQQIHEREEKENA